MSSISKIITNINTLTELQNYDEFDIEDLIEILQYADDAYYNSDAESLLTDIEYDFLYQYTQSRNSAHSYFIGIGSDVRGGKVKLPYPMGSLNQVYEGQLAKWINKHGLSNEEIIPSDKLDGTSAMVVYDADGNLQIAYSRGNGIEGADITRHIRKLQSVPENCGGHRVIRGEVIIEVDSFRFIQTLTTTRSGKIYKNPRNFVAGIMNSKEKPDEIYQYIKFVAYEIVGETSLSKEEQFRELEALGFEVPYRKGFKGKELTDEALTAYLNLRRQDSVYEIDGLVLDVDSNVRRKAMAPSRDSLNPGCAVKYKVMDEHNLARVRVNAVLWALSKHGYLKPRVQIEPVELDGVTIEYCTGFNAKFILENGIGVGAILDITRSGNVIPFILDVVQQAAPELPPLHTWKWSWSEEGVDAIVDNPEDYCIVAVKRITDFFEKIDAPLLKQGNVQKLYDAGLTSVSVIIRAEFGDLTGILGENGNKVYDGLRKVLTDIPLHKIIGAYSTYRGIGVRRMKLLQTELGSEALYNCDDITDLVGVDGFDIKTATLAKRAIDDFRELYENDNMQAFITIAKEKEVGTALAGEKVCLTGFRDKELGAKIESLGGTVQSGVSGKTTILIAKNPDSTSGKMNKARDNGTRIMGVDDFNAEFNC